MHKRMKNGSSINPRQTRSLQLLQRSVLFSSSDSSNLQHQVSSDNYPGVFNIENHQWSERETSHLIAGMLFKQTMEQMSTFFNNSNEYFSWPATYCYQRVVDLAASEVQLPRDWLLPNTLFNPPFVPQLSADEEAELRLFVQTGQIYTYYVFRDYRTCEWVRMACGELYEQRRNQPELWVAKYLTARDASNHRRQGMRDRWLQWRQESTERRERLEAAQRQRLVTDEEIAGWEDG